MNHLTLLCAIALCILTAPEAFAQADRDCDGVRVPASISWDLRGGRQIASAVRPEPAATAASPIRAPERSPEREVTTTHAIPTATLPAPAGTPATPPTAPGAMGALAFFSIGAADLPLPLVVEIPTAALMSPAALVAGATPASASTGAIGATAPSVLAHSIAPPPVSPAGSTPAVTPVANPVVTSPAYASKPAAPAEVVGGALIGGGGGAVKGAEGAGVGGAGGVK